MILVHLEKPLFVHFVFDCAMTEFKWRRCAEYSLKNIYLDYVGIRFFKRFTLIFKQFQ